MQPGIIYLSTHIICCACWTIPKPCIITKTHLKILHLRTKNTQVFFNHACFSNTPVLLVSSPEQMMGIASDVSFSWLHFARVAIPRTTFVVARPNQWSASFGHTWVPPCELACDTSLAATYIGLYLLLQTTETVWHKRLMLLYIVVAYIYIYIP